MGMYERKVTNMAILSVFFITFVPKTIILRFALTSVLADNISQLLLINQCLHLKK